jgi:hypothetical protein
MKKKNKVPSRKKTSAGKNISHLERGQRAVFLDLLNKTDILIRKLGLCNDKIIISCKYHDISIKINDIQVISTSQDVFYFGIVTVILTLLLHL